MNRKTLGLLGGLVLIALGITYLLEYLNIISIGSWVWGGLIALGGLLFLSVYLGNREHWWAIIPGVILLGIAATVFVVGLYPAEMEIYGGTIVLSSIGLAFLFVYLANRENWWALIPMGVMTTLAVFVGWGNSSGGINSIGIFFLGLGLTFLLVAIVPTAEGQLRWALIPAGILLMVGVLFLTNFPALLTYLWPLVLILAGILIIFRTIVRR
jgi:hypothetical protein